MLKGGEGSLVTSTVVLQMPEEKRFKAVMFCGQTQKRRSTKPQLGRKGKVGGIVKGQEQWGLEVGLVLCILMLITSPQHLVAAHMSIFLHIPVLVMKTWPKKLFLSDQLKAYTWAGPQITKVHKL